MQQQYTLLKADEVLPKYVAELAQKTNILLVLSNMGQDEDKRLSSAVRGVDLIVGGRQRSSAEVDTWRWVNPQSGTIVLQAGTQGEWIGRTLLHFDGAGIVTVYSSDFTYLTADFADDPEMRAFLDNYKAQ